MFKNCPWRGRGRSPSQASTWASVQKLPYTTARNKDPEEGKYIIKIKLNKNTSNQQKQGKSQKEGKWGWMGEGHSLKYLLGYGATFSIDALSVNYHFLDSFSVL